MTADTVKIMSASRESVRLTDTTSVIKMFDAPGAVVKIDRVFEAVVKITAAPDTCVLVVSEKATEVPAVLVATRGPQGARGEDGKDVTDGRTLFTDISAAFASDINARLNVLDQFEMSLKNTDESSDFLTIYKLHI